MFNPMNGVSATDKLGLGPEVRELKFGSSFTGNNKSQGGSFHTIRYDFKPASVDTTKMAKVEVGQNSQVTITVPHSDGVGANVFKGPRKPYSKECVLIIDQETGEVVLEKLTHNITVKKTRQEGGSRMAKGMPPAPAPPPEVKKPPQPPHHKPEAKISKSSSSSSQQMSQSNAMRRSPMTSVPSRHSPLGPSPNRQSPPQAINNNTTSASAAFDTLLSKQSQSSLPSLTSIEDLLDLTPPPPPPARNIPIPNVTVSAPTPNPTSQIKPSKKEPHPTIPAVTPTALSESSSGDDSSSSSSSGSDDDSSDEEMEVVPDEVPIKNKSLSPHISMPSLTGPGLSKPLPMPQISNASDLLSEDLQLSESGSDSD